MSQEKMHPISELTDAAMSDLRALVDVNTIIGDPITTGNGTVIIPISKISFGYGTGGSDLPTAAPDKFAGGSGAGVSISPIAFLVVSNDDVRLLELSTADNTNDRLVNAGAGIAEQVIGLISKKGKKDEKKTQTPSKDFTENDFSDTLGDINDL